MQHHSARVTEAIREELSEIIGFELSDPRLGAVDVVSVALAPGSRLATACSKLSAARVGQPFKPPEDSGFAVRARRRVERQRTCRNPSQTREKKALSRGKSALK
jgi:hypothetical protein